MLETSWCNRLFESVVNNTSVVGLFQMTVQAATAIAFSSNHFDEPKFNLKTLECDPVRNPFVVVKNWVLFSTLSINFVKEDASAHTEDLWPTLYSSKLEHS